MRTTPRTTRTTVEGEPEEALDEAPAAAAGRADALGATGDALEAWAGALEGAAPEAARAIRRAGAGVEKVRRLGQLGAATAKGLRGALAAFRAELRR